MFEPTRKKVFQTYIESLPNTSRTNGKRSDEREQLFPLRELQRHMPPAPLITPTSLWKISSNFGFKKRIEASGTLVLGAINMKKEELVRGQSTMTSELCLFLVLRIHSMISAYGPTNFAAFL